MDEGMKREKEEEGEFRPITGGKNCPTPYVQLGATHKVTNYKK